MHWDLRRYGLEHFGHIEHRKSREHAAEVDLVIRFFDRSPTGYFIDVGANEPELFNQTFEMEKLGWTGLLVEPIPAMCDKLRAGRPNATVLQVACSSPDQVGTAEFHVSKNPAQSTLTVGKATANVPYLEVIIVQVTTLDMVLREQPPQRLDFVSIDVEGFQLDVLKGFDIEKHRPRLLFVEDHLLSLKTHKYVTARGYKLVKRTGLNNWYIPAGEPFEMTSFGERFALWRKMWLRTPFRRLRFMLKRKSR